MYVGGEIHDVAFIEETLCVLQACVQEALLYVLAEQAQQIIHSAVNMSAV